MKNILLFWIYTFCWSCTVYGGPLTVYTDCEHPPTIHHSKSELSVDDDGIVVTALYTCDAGYQLHGQAQITCNTDTDEWQNDLPVCKLGTGENSPVSEIEQPEVIDSVITISPDITHEEIEIAKPIEDPSTDHPNEIQIDPGQSSPDSDSIPSEPEETDLIESEDRPSASSTGQKKRRRKGKNDFQEDNTIDEDFASHLDMTCIDGTVAPSVNDAYIVEYIRAKKGDYKFLVAVYDCVEYFVLENPQSNRLYCSQGTWVGTHPVCISNGDLDYGNETGDDDDDDNNNDVDNDQNGNDSVNKSDANNSTPSSQQPNNESEIYTETKVETPETVENRNDAPPSCDVNNGGCEQACTMVSDEETGESIAECSCQIGFYLDNSGLKCLDLNECEDPNVSQLCPNGCENTIGSYRCVESSDVEIIESNVDVSQATEPNAPVKACGDGLRLDESNNCIDIDECAEGNTGCEYCQNINGGYQCTCPDGFELNNDEKTCRDINECTTFSDYEYEDNTPTVRTICSHECVNTIGSFVCRCPLNFHLREDQRTCEQDLCRHLGDIASNKTKCSHDCVDEADGYHCKCPDGMDLDADLKTCISLDICATEGDRCLPGKCVATNDGSFRCECPTGFAEYNRRCIDYDECAIATHKCSHQCKNIDGSYLCECPDDLILASDGHTCISSDLCAIDNGGCSDTCNIVNEKVVCSCPEGTELNADGQTCGRKNICSSNNGGCDHVCNVELNRCECHPGFQSFDDGKTCQDLNECLQNNGGCRQQCINREGSFECTCFEGFEKDEESDECYDRNECELNNGNCDHTCVNTEGSYLCSCRPGFHLSNDQHQCFDINECDSNNGNCSHTCVNLQGSYQCSCPEGFKLDHDKVTCIEIKDKCSALAAPQFGDVRCSRSRHPSQWFYQTKCSFWCNEGYTLIGTPVKYCNGSDGFWDSAETTCIPSTCPPLPAPEVGSLRPECLKGKIYPGESCAIICPPRYKKVGQAVAHCLPSRQWSTTNLNCAPVKVPPPPNNRVQQGEIHSRGQIDLETSAASRKNLLKPYIKCPRDTTILLPNNQKAVHIKLEQPKTNVDWASHVEAHPPWAKRLQAQLAAGVHTITFRARSPNSVSISDECRTVIVVQPANAPQVLYCPQSIQVDLGPNEIQRSISWTEPTFRPHQQLRQIFKSHLPGTSFRAGHHKITYIATDIQNLNASCQFSVVVRPARVARVTNPIVRPQFGQQYQNPLQNHDSYLLCPNQPAMKLDTSFPIRIPNGCIIKNVRKLNQIQPYNPHRRRHAFTPNNNFLRYYSSWNSPEYSRFFS